MATYFSLIPIDVTLLILRYTTRKLHQTLWLGTHDDDQCSLLLDGASPMKESVGTIISGLKLSEQNDSLDAHTAFASRLGDLSLEWMPRCSKDVIANISQKLIALRSLKIKITNRDTQLGKVVPHLLQNIGAQLEELEYNVYYISDTSLKGTSKSLSASCTSISKLALYLPRHKDFDVFIPTWNSLRNRLKSISLSAHYGSMEADPWDCTFKALQNHCLSLNTVEVDVASREQESYARFLTGLGHRLVHAHLGAMSTAFCSNLAVACKKALFDFEAHQNSIRGVLLLGPHLRRLKLGLVNIRCTEELIVAMDSCSNLEALDVMSWGHEDAVIKAIFNRPKRGLKRLSLHARQLYANCTQLDLIATSTGSLKELDISVRELQDSKAFRNIGLNNPELESLCVREESKRGFIDPHSAILGVLRNVQDYSGLKKVQIYLRLAPWISLTDELKIAALSDVLRFRSVDIEICRLETESSQIVPHKRPWIWFPSS